MILVMKSSNLNDFKKLSSSLKICGSIEQR